MKETGARIVIWDDADYPPLLKNLPDAPPVLYIKGQLNTADCEWTVAIVGTRRATAYGRQVAEMLATDLAHNGITIVSGLARGIDAYAHEAALRAGGRTLGVLACGIDQCIRRSTRSWRHAWSNKARCSPKRRADHRPKAEIFRRVIASSAACRWARLWSKRPKPAARSSPDRSLEQGREVFAVPGNIFARTSLGPNIC